MKSTTELERIRSQHQSEGQFEGGSNSEDEGQKEIPDGHSKQQYNTIDMHEHQRILDNKAQKPAIEGTQPMYKLSIKSIGKNSIKINPSKHSNRVEPRNEQITPKQGAVGTQKKQKILIGKPNAQKVSSSK